MILFKINKYYSGIAFIFIRSGFIIPCFILALRTPLIAQENGPSASDTGTVSGLRYPINEQNNYPFSTSGNQSPLLLRPPSNINQNIEYDPVSGRYIFTEKVGELNYRNPASMSLDEYRHYEADNAKTEYWREKSLAETGAGPSFMKNLRLGNQTVDKIFGTDVISIVPKGQAELIFGYSISTNKNPLLPVANRRNGSFIFKEKIEMNVTGSIGDKMEVGLSYNTEATFDFENKTKLAYSGKEDEIIKKIEAGDVTFSVPGSLITGSQSLFGLKTELQFGRMTVTSVISHQEGESSSIDVQGGAQVTDFEVDVNEYDANRHYFLSQFFRDHYNSWLASLPFIESQVQIQTIEVWAVNRQSDYSEVRNIVGIMDLAEGYDSASMPNFYADEDIIEALQRNDQPPDNTLNSLYAKLDREMGKYDREFENVESAIANATGNAFSPGRDYAVLKSARPISEREYTLNRELGFISLNSPLRNDEVLAVSFTYTYRGKTYQVGELSTEVGAPKTLIVKLLKSSIISTKYPIWDLMMKNVYAIGAYQVSAENFILNVLYRNDKTGVPVNYISEKDTTIMSSGVNNQPLIKVLELDNLDARNEPNPDGQFDYVEGLTINSRNGRIYFPLLEPFGSDMRRKMVAGVDNSKLTEANRLADKYVYEELYDSTQTKAEQIAEKNKFFLKGQYQSSSSSEIQLNAMNIPRGSVVVSAGGVTLTENADYTVDYTLGRVKIINQGLLESGTPIRITLESNSLFSIQTKTLLGTHLDYKISENFNVGATVMHLKETPLTKKVNMGDEPISNTIWGLNTSYRTQSQLLTTLVDKIPFIETKQPSSILLEGEFAQLIPGQVKDIEGAAYIDDFEAAQTKIELKTFSNWFLSSPPRDVHTFDSIGGTLLEPGYSRAKLAWYVIDPLFYSNSGLNPENDSINVDKESHYARRIKEQEIFPLKQDELIGENFLSVLNLAYYPDERGPYNFNPWLTSEGKLTSPETRWGGMMREIINSDFETSNVEFIEFWLLDPYLEDPLPTGGDLYIQLGEISEDILPDTAQSFEGGLPSDPNDIRLVDTTTWGRVPTTEPYVNTFAGEEGRAFQDAGLDGLTDNDENTFFAESYLNRLSTDAKSIVEQDPSADDFMYFLDEEHDDKNHGIFERYKNYNNVEGNSPPTEANQQYTPSNTLTPDIEDINRDNTMNNVETYFQYKISLRPEDMKEVGKNFIVDTIEAEIPDFDTPARWLQFRIPLGDWESKVGDIEDFKSIRFMRMMLTDFDKKVVLRFATLDLVRADWRRYFYDLSETNPETTEQQGDAVLEVSAVNIEENSRRSPINYVLPPGVTRENDPANTQLQYLNEQSLSLKVKGLEDGDARSVFKNVELDLRQHKNLEMWIHAEALPDEEGLLANNDLNAFIRLGSDYRNNYYEFEIPLAVSPHGVDSVNSVWPAVNEMDLLLEDLVNLKQERNDRVREDPSNYSTQSVYSKQYGSYTIKVKGNPNLANVRQIMLGVRNPGDAGSYGHLNDALAKSGEVWFNELRLVGFKNKGGWAANGRVQAQLADFGVVNAAASKSTPGFGSIEEKVAERSIEETNQYDVSSNLEMGKFFPEKAEVSIPLYVGVSKTIINPQYFPKDPDITMEEILEQAKNKEERDSLKRISQDLTSRASINITNMRWNKKFKKVNIVSPGNITASLGYTQTRARNYSTEYNNLWKYNASLNYVYNSKPKNIQPFKKSKGLKKPAYRIIRDINFNPYPSRFTFGTDLNRNYQEIKIRNVYEGIDLLIEPTVNKDFNWDRKYDLKWDITRGLKLDYSATDVALIGEPQGQQDLFKANNELWKDSVWQSMKQGGRDMNFTQKLDLSYTVPINKIPLFNWVSLNASYGTTYNWIRGEIVPGIDSLGNTIKNSNNIKLSSNLTLKSLYSKFNYLKTLETKYSKTKNQENKKQPEDESRFKTVQYEKQTFLKKDVPKTINHKLNTEVVEVSVVNEQGSAIAVQMSTVNENRITITASEDVAVARITVTGKIPKGQNPLIFIGDNALRLITGFKSVNVSWNRSAGSVLPGYLPETNMFGINLDDYYGAPGWPFVLGEQDTGLVRHAIDNDWITKVNTFNKPYEYNMRSELMLKANFEPFNGFRLELSGNRSYSEYSERIFFHDDTLGLANYNNYFVDKMYTGGSFSISVITIFTAFEKIDETNGFESKAFNQLRDNRSVISARRYREREDSLDFYNNQVYHGTPDGYYDGYGPTSQEVLIPAFISAYTGIDPDKVTFKTFFWNMMPNWRITYDGLSELPFVQRFLKTITLTHSYKSTYSVTSFASNLSYYENFNSEFFSPYPDDANQSGEEIRGMMRDNQNNFIPEYMINSVSIKEQINPLIGFDMTWHNSLLTKFEIGRSRTILLSMNNNQVNESQNRDFTIGAGYRFKEVPLTIRAGGNKKQIKNDLNLRFDASVRKNITIIRFLTINPETDEATNVTTGGRKLTLGFTADYMFSETFNIQFFIDREVNKPFTTTSYDNSETNIGFNLRLSL